MHIHSVFRILLRDSAAEDPLPGQVLLPPLPVEINGEEEYFIDEILNSCI